MTLDEALDAVHEIMDDAAFGKAGSRVVIEEFMDGRKPSLAFTDGKTICPPGQPRTTSAPTTATKAPTPAAWAPMHRHRS